MNSCLDICIIGYGSFGQFLDGILSKHHRIICVDKDASLHHPRQVLHLDQINSLVNEKVDVIILAVSILSLREVLELCQPDLFSGKLVVDVCSVKIYPKQLLTSFLPINCDIICTHPMFGPQSGKHGLQGLTFMFDIVRISNETRHTEFLGIWEKEGCLMLEMTAEEHDEKAAHTQFVTHLVGRVLDRYGIERTPIDTRSYKDLLSVKESVCNNSDDLFCGIYAFNPYASVVVEKLPQSLKDVDDHLVMRKSDIL